MPILSYNIQTSWVPPVSLAVLTLPEDAALVLLVSVGAPGLGAVGRGDCADGTRGHPAPHVSKAAPFGRVGFRFLNQGR